MMPIFFLFVAVFFLLIGSANLRSKKPLPSVGVLIQLAPWRAALFAGTVLFAIGVFVWVALVK
jgi:hypothetical protein